MSVIKNKRLLTDATATGYSDECQPVFSTKRSFQVTAKTSAGAGACVVTIQGSNLTSPVLSTDVEWVTLGTVTFTNVTQPDTTKVSDGFTTDAPWFHIRAKVVSISGTGNTVNVWMAQ